jgi:hypothetical protein
VKSRLYGTINKRGPDRKLNERRSREGVKVMALDKTKTEGKVRFSWTPKRKRKKESLEEAKKQYAALTRIGHVSMVQIGENEFRTPTRRERRHAKIRHRNRSPLERFAQQKGVPGLGRHTVRVDMSEAAVANRQYMAAAAREVGTTRRAKLQRKAIEENNRLVEAGAA